jgi:hypothetical protein
MENKEALFAALVLGLLGGLIAVFLADKPKNLVYEVTYFTVDSTWYTTPGQENSMQTEYKYYARLNNGKIIRTSNKPFEIGDTAKVVIINEK